MVITGLGVGGAERQVLDLADRLSERGHVVKIAYLTGYVRLLPSDSRVEVLSLGVKNKISGLFYGLINLLRLIKGFEPDVIHSHMVHANIISRLARLFTSFPVLVCTAHSKNEGGLLRMFFYRLTDSLADISTNVGIDAVKSFEKLKAVPPGRMISMVNGIDAERFKPDFERRAILRQEMGLSPDVKLILAVGRFYEPKDYPNLLSAFTCMADDFPSAQLWIAGDGPLMEKMKMLAVELGVGSRVKFLGARSDIPDLMKVTDLYVLSSAWEGLPLVVGEAMASERLVVATDCGGVREFLGDAGILVEPKNSIALADGLRAGLRMNKEESALLSERARKRILEGYSLEHVTERWIDLYRGL